MKKVIGKFILFLIFVAVYGACMVLANNLLRKYGYDSQATLAILIASTVYVYYKAWKWLCEKLDSIEK